MQKQSVPNDTATQHVFVTVAGGVAYVAGVPETVAVHIIDYDDLKADFEFTFNQLSPEAQDFYRRAEQAVVGSSGIQHG